MADVQVGQAYLQGVAGTITMTGVATFNASTRTLADEFSKEEIPASAGDIIEAVIYSKRQRSYVCEFAPKGASRVAAEAVIDTLFATSMGATVTIGGSTVSAYNGTYNYEGGAYIRETRDGYAVAGINLRQYENSTPGTFAALATVS